MDVREKLVELIFDSLCRHVDKSCKLAENIADDLISSGVTVQENVKISDELLKQLKNAPITICKEESSIVTVQEWISVKDRLPDKKGAFLVYVKTKNKWCGYIKTTWFTPCYEGVEEDMQGKQVWYDYDSDWGDYEVRDVTHWMPLPPAPEDMK